MKSAAPCLIAFDRVLHRAEAGDDDRDDFGIALERGVEHGAAVDAGQPQVGDDDVEREVGEARERLFAARCLLDDEAVVGQPFGDGLAQRRLVVDEQQMFRGFSHLVVRRYFDTRASRGQRRSVVRGTLQSRAYVTPDNSGHEQQGRVEPER